MTPVSVDMLRVANKDGRNDLMLQQINWCNWTDDDWRSVEWGESRRWTKKVKA